MIVLASASAFAQARSSSDVCKLGPRDFVTSGIKEVIVLLNDKVMARKQKTLRLRQILRRYFDQATMGRHALGRHYRTASPAQIAAYMAAMEDYVIYAYGNLMITYSSRIANFNVPKDALTVVNSRKVGRRDVLVYSEVKGKPGDKIVIAWRVRRRDNCLGVVDVMVAGLSQALTYRQVFSSVITRHKDGLDGLIESIRQKNAILRIITGDAPN